MPDPNDVIALRAGDRLGWGRTRGARSLTAAELLGEPANDGPLPDMGPIPPIGSPNPQVMLAAFQEVGRQGDELVAIWLDRLVGARSQFVEKMTWFWHGHFATGMAKVQVSQMLAGQNNTQRKLATGSFLDLAQAMVVDPATIYWLDGQLNSKGVPNENLGRELMELFILGVNHYGEDDVRQAARALVGLTADRASGWGGFRPQEAEPGVKVVLDYPVTDPHSLVSMLVARQEAARYIVGRIWSRFVSATPPPPEAMDRLVAAFGDRRDIAALMRALAAEPAFSDPASVLVKQPVEWAVGLMRVLAVPFAALPPSDRQIVMYTLKQLGQIPFDPPSVGGWPEGSAWLSTGSALQRLMIAQRVASQADLSLVSDAAPADRADAAIQLIGMPGVTQRTRAAIKAAGTDPTTIVATAACAPEYVVSR